MKYRMLPVALLLAVASLLPAQSGERDVRLFAERYQTHCEGGTIDVKVNTQSEQFTYFFLSRDCPHGKKHNFGMPIIYVPKEKKLFVGEYMNVNRLKEMADNSRAVEVFFGEILGGKVNLTLMSDKEVYKIYDLAVETGYGAVHHTAYRFKKLHFILGKVYEIGEDPRKRRIDDFPWDRYPSIGNPQAPHKLSVFLDLECPMCAKVEEDLIEILSNRDDVYVSFIQFPLVSIHPWAFRGACGAMCYARLNHDLYFEFLTDLYAQKDLLNLDNIDIEVFGFGDARDLRPHLLDCYLKPDNIKEVLDQVQLALKLGVRFTPGLYYDGTLYAPSDLITMLKGESKEKLKSTEK